MMHLKSQVWGGVHHGARGNEFEDAVEKHKQDDEATKHPCCPASSLSVLICFHCRVVNFSIVYGTNLRAFVTERDARKRQVHGAIATLFKQAGHSKKIIVDLN